MLPVTGSKVRMKMHVGEEDNEIGGGQHTHHPHYNAYNKHGELCPKICQLIRQKVPQVILD